MPSFQDSAFIFFLALLLFGPKKLPELARQLGKLMGEFRRASNEFRMQMDDELRLAEQAENQKKIAAIEAAAPVAPALETGVEPTIAAPIEDPMDHHPHTMLASDPVAVEPAIAAEPTMAAEPTVDAEQTVVAESIPIASSGDLHMMPPSTGLPVGRSAPSSSGASSVGNSSVESVFAAIPEAPSETDEPSGSHRSSEVDTMSRAETPLPTASAEVPQHG